MASIHSYITNNNTFILHPHHVLFWQEEKTLILSDLHIGKTNHFRKNGIAVPITIIKEDIQRLIDSIQFFKPQKVIIVGDLFHSIENKEHEWLAKWRNDFAAIEFILVKGNHDIVEEEWYKKNNIEVYKELKVKDFVFVHSIEDCNIENKKEYIISGHVHPAVTIKGLGKQSLRFPCFYFTENHAILPAFGKFTGTYNVEAKKGNTVFAVVNQSIIEIK